MGLTFGSGMKFGGGKPKKAVKQSEKQEAKQTDYQQRAKAEQKRFKNAVDGEFWLCFCFKNQEDRDRFGELFGEMPRFVAGADFRRMTESAKPETVRHGFPRKQRGAKFPDPLKDVPETDSLERDCIAEADALLAALKSVEMPEPCKCSSDSSIWVTVAFDSREDADSYLSEMGIAQYGNKYVDASAWLSAM